MLKKNKNNRNITIKICTSKKACGDNYGEYNWERICNDYGQTPSKDTFTANGITFIKGVNSCQGLCTKKSNIQVIKNNEIIQFSFMTPLKTSKLVNFIRNGTPVKNIKRL
jgi:hypothetical protein